MRKPIGVGYFEETDTEIQFVEDGHSHLRIYEWPEDNKIYVLGSDVAGGGEGDAASA